MVKATRLDKIETLNIVVIDSRVKSFFDSCEYMYIDSLGHVLLFENSYEKISNIPHDSVWTYYLIDDILYKTFYTNKLSYFDKLEPIKKKEKQMKLF